MKSLSAAVLPLLVVASCGGDPSEDLCATAALEPVSLVLGTGSIFFEDITDGQDLPISQGPQGGFHVYGSLRASGLHPGTWEDFTDPLNPVVSFDIIDSDGQTLGGFTELPRPLKVRSDGTLELVGEYVVLDIGEMNDVTFQTVTLSVEVADTCGSVISDQQEVFLVPS